MSTRHTHHGNTRFQKIGRKRYRVCAACGCSRCQRRRVVQHS